MKSEEIMLLLLGIVLIFVIIFGTQKINEQRKECMEKYKGVAIIDLPVNEDGCYIKLK